MERSTRASAASVIPPESISIPSDADNASSQNQTKKPMVQYVIGQAAPQSEPTMDLAAAKSILDQLGIGQNTPAEQTEEDVVMTNESGERPAKRAKKPKAEVVYITCDLCGVIMSSEAIAQLHYAGKKHLKKLKAQGVLKVTSYPPVDPSDPLGLSSPVVAPVLPQLLVGPEGLAVKRGEYRFCSTCNIELNSATTAKMHYAGKNHQKKLRDPPVDPSDPLGLSSPVVAPVPPQLLLGPEGLAMKRGEYRFCSTCNIELNSATTAKMHYAGKNHQKKLKALGLAASGSGLMDNKEIVHTSAKRTVVAPTDAPLDPMDTSAASARTVVAPSANGDGSATILKCEVCDIEFNSPTHAEMHYQGKKHAKKVKLLLEGPTPQPEPQPKKTKAAVEASQLFCELCKINTTGVEQMKMHLEGAKHKSTEAAKMNPATVESGGGGGKLIASYDCNTCSVQMNSEQQFLQHMGSPKHQTKLTGRPDKARFHPYQKPGLGAAGGAQQGSQQVGQQAIPPAAEDISEVILQQQ